MDKPRSWGAVALPWIDPPACHERALAELSPDWPLAVTISAVGPRPILFLAKDWALDGAERQLAYLTCHLDPRRFIPVVLTDRAGPLTAYLRANGVEVYVLPFRAWRQFGFFLLRYIDALRAASVGRTRRVALVHASDLWKSPYAVFISRRLGVPSVVHVRGPLTSRDTAKQRLTGADGIIVISRRYERDLYALGLAPERVALVDDAVDLQRFAPEVDGTAFRRQWGVGARLAVGLVGRLDPFKRVLEFLEMAAAAERMLPGAALYLLVGATGPRQYMRQIDQTIARLGLSGRVILTGRVDAMPEAIAGLDILATFSGGSVMFEAMACAKPVLSVRTDGRQAVHTRHDQTAWCITTDQPSVAATGLLTLLHDAALRQRLGQAARRHVEAHLSPLRLAEQTQAFYDRLLRNGSESAS